MHPLIESLRNLSSAANEALLHLEKYDYHKEADELQMEKLNLTVIPKQLQEIVNSIMAYCVPLEHDGCQVKGNALLNNTNMQLFVENMELCGDRTLLRQFNHIDIEPISEVAEQFNQIGLSKQARLLENSVTFARKMRSYGRCQSFKNSNKDKAPILISFTLSPEELTEEQQHDAQLYKDFTSIFRPGVFSSSQRRALYDAYRTLLSTSGIDKPHLIIITSLLLLINKKSYGKPLTGSLNKIRATVFTSLGLPENTAKSYATQSLQKNARQSLFKHIDQAEQLLSEVVRKTR